MPDPLTISGQARSALRFLRASSDIRRLLVNEWAETETGTVVTSPWLAERRADHGGWRKTERLAPSAVAELSSAGLVELDRYGNGCRLLRLSDAGKEVAQ
jgi:hypothetical protein